jgi:hypothetical protein
MRRVQARGHSRGRWGLCAGGCSGLFLKLVESLVAHQLFESVGEFRGVEVLRLQRRVVVSTVRHGGRG